MSDHSATRDYLEPKAQTCQREGCGASLEGKRAGARFCSNECRSRQRHADAKLSVHVRAQACVDPRAVEPAPEVQAPVQPAAYSDYLERKGIEPKPKSGRDRVRAYLAWSDGGRHGEPPAMPSLEDCGELTWPGNVLAARRIHGYRGTMFDEPPSRLI